MEYFQNYKRKDYIRDNLKYLIPMTAQEAKSDEIDTLFNDPEYIIEEKIDGTRGTLFVSSGFLRIFSRRISVKTDWFCENSDSIPHIRDFIREKPNLYGLEGTVLDGELYVPNKNFKDVSSTLNCKWEEAIKRQEEIGKICFKVFDIRYYKGECIENLPLIKRKEYLENIVKEISCPYIILHDWHIGNLVHIPSLGLINNKSYYEHIVNSGGEGVMLKHKDGIYHEKRGREYLKVKKSLTRDVFIIGYSPPKKEYTGKFPHDFWEYWIIPSLNNKKYKAGLQESASSLLRKGCIPVTRYYFREEIGAVQFGVFATQEDINKNKKIRKTNIIPTEDNLYIIKVGECSGFDDNLREKISLNPQQFIHSVIEVKCNEVFSETGKMRHPRFLRFRTDKDYMSCTLKEHLI